MSKTIRQPRQDRSRRTYEAILGAAEKLLETRSFRDLTLEDVVREAGCTVGAFYHRFQDKQSLLLHIEERFYGGAAEMVRETLTAAQEHEGRELVVQVIRGFTNLYFTWRASLRVLVIQSASDPELAERMTARSRAVSEQLSAMLKDHVAIRGADPEAKLRFAFAAARSMLREAVLFESSSVFDRPVRCDDLAREIACMFAAYLADDSTSPNSRRHPRH